MSFPNKIINYSDNLIDPCWIPLNFLGDSWDTSFQQILMKLNICIIQRGVLQEKKESVKENMQVYKFASNIPQFLFMYNNYQYMPNNLYNL